MKEIIHFRSSVGRTRGGAGSREKMKSRGSDIESLRPMISSDDARDIAWKQSAKSENLSVKSREEDQTLSLRLITLEDPSWTFSVEGGDTKRSFSSILEESCRYTSRTFGYPFEKAVYTREGISGIVKHLEKNRTSSELIIIISSDLDVAHYSGLEKIALHNDIILIHLLHPYESYPEDFRDILSESQSVMDIVGYREALAYSKEAIRLSLIRSHMSYISGLSTEDPIGLLNHFFKNRYAHH